MHERVGTTPNNTCRCFIYLFVDVQLEIPVPDDVTKRKTTLELDPAGDWMHLSFQNRPDFEPLEGKFKNLISPLDSVWMLGKRACSSLPHWRIFFLPSMLYRYSVTDPTDLDAKHCSQTWVWVELRCCSEQVASSAECT